jgi:acetoacetyl-CoA synthetase
VQVRALPQTHNGKYSERAARDVVNGREPPNRAALRNPECLAELAERCRV